MLDLDLADRPRGTQTLRRGARIEDICGHGTPQKGQQCVSEVAVHRTSAFRSEFFGQRVPLPTIL